MAMDHSISSIEAINHLEDEIEARLASRDDAVMLADGQTVVEAVTGRPAAADFIIDTGPVTRA